MNFIHYSFFFCIYLGEVIPKIKDATMTIQKFVGTTKEATDATKHSKSLSKSRMWNLQYYGSTRARFIIN